MARILVVDDEHQIGRAIQSSLEREGDEVVVAYTGLDAVDLTATGNPDLLVVDLHLPDIQGTEVVRRVRPWFSRPILVLSGASDERSRVEALDAGADDFLTKPFGLAELQARLRALQRRSNGRPGDGVPTLVTYGDLRIDLAARALTAGGREVLLTPTEWRLLVAFVSSPGVLLTHQRLLTEGWSQGYGDESRQALRAHIRSLRSKIGDPASEPVYIRTESGIGYRWVAGDAASVPAGTATSADDVVHDLSNVVTSMRLTLDLADVIAEGEGASAEFLARMTELVDRVTMLVAELDGRREGG